jgi:DNA modification methylase
MLPDNSVDCCVTSPPYFNLRYYGNFSKQIGLEKTPEKYIEKLIVVFREVYRVLKDTGTCWVNIGDTYSRSGKNNKNTKPLAIKQMSNSESHKVKAHKIKTLPPKSLIGIPWRFALAMIDDGWILRQDIIWSKPSVMPESVKDRFCKSHEYIFLFVKKQKYYFDHQHALEPATSLDGRNNNFVKRSKKYADKNATGLRQQTMSARESERCPQRGYITKKGGTGLSEQHHGVSIPTYPLRTKHSVWVVANEPSKLNHFAMFPQRLILPCILCGCPENGIVLDPFIGSGTTALVAKNNFRKYIGCEINPEYVKIAESRITGNEGLFDGSKKDI